MKRAFSLLETMISLALFSILLTSLFWWYHHFTVQKAKFHESKWPLLEERYAQQRLDKIFSQTSLPFFSTEYGFVFSFDRGLHENPLLANQVLARLYHNPKSKELCLGIWPNQDPLLLEPSETFVLLEDVEKFDCEFYYPPPANRKIVDPKKVGTSSPLRGWNKCWETAFWEVPALIKLKLKRKGREVTFAFDLHCPIYYGGSEIGS